MKIRTTSSPALFAAVVLAGAATAPVLAAPADALLPATQTKVLTQTVKSPAVLTLTPAAATLKVIAPAAATVKALVPAAPAKRLRVNRESSYRYSNPSRWNSDVTNNSIRNQ